MNDREHRKKKSVIDRWRTAVQVLCLVLLNPFVYRYMGVCIPVMNCWACPAAAFSCPVGVVGNFLVRGLFPFAVIGVTVLFAIAAGRILCGWVCPFGLLQDLLNKIPSPKYTVPDRVNRWLFLAPLSFLVVTVFLVPVVLGTDSKLYFCNFCPAGALEAGIPGHITSSDGSIGVVLLELLGFWRVWILLICLVAFVIIKRPFCRLICPIGIAMGLFNWLSFLKISHGLHYWSNLFGAKVAPVKACPLDDCGCCTEECPVDLVAIRDVNKRDCIYCYLCTESCPPRDGQNGFTAAAGDHCSSCNSSCNH